MPPKDPPAPIITSIPPDFSAASCNNFEIWPLIGFQVTSIAAMIAIDSAITGSPRIEMICAAAKDALPSTPTIDLAPINAIGSMTGRKAAIVGILLDEEVSGTSLMLRCESLVVRPAYRVQ